MASFVGNPGAHCAVMDISLKIKKNTKVCNLQALEAALDLLIKATRAHSKNKFKKRGLASAETTMHSLLLIPLKTLLLFKNHYVRPQTKKIGDGSENFKLHIANPKIGLHESQDIEITLKGQGYTISTITGSAPMFGSSTDNSLEPSKTTSFDEGVVCKAGLADSGYSCTGNMECLVTQTQKLILLFMVLFNPHPEQKKLHISKAVAITIGLGTISV